MTKYNLTTYIHHFDELWNDTYSGFSNTGLRTFA